LILLENSKQSEHANKFRKIKDRCSGYTNISPSER